MSYGARAGRQGGPAGEAALPTGGAQSPPSDQRCRVQQTEGSEQGERQPAAANRQQNGALFGRRKN